jgi:tetratricopeptide (TPR) repeat protein
MDADRANEIVTLAEEAGPELRGPEAATWIRHLEPLREDVDTAVMWFLEHREARKGLRIAAAMWPAWVDTGDRGQARRTLGAVLDATARDRSSARIQALYGAGLFAFREGDQSTARALNMESLETALASGDRAAAALALIGLSRVAYRDGDFVGVRGYCQRSMDISNELGDRVGMSRALHILSEVARLEGDLPEARRLYEEGIELDREVGDLRHVAMQLTNLAFVDKNEGRLEEATRRVRESIELARQIGHAAQLPLCLMAMGTVAVEGGEDRRGALLLGAFQALFDEDREVLDPTDQPEFDRAVATVKERLGPAEFQAAWAEGAALGADRAIALAMGEGPS